MPSTYLPWLSLKRDFSLPVEEAPPPPPMVSYGLLALLALIGVLLELVEPRVQNEAVKGLLQHGSSAAIVASVIGLTYERVIHKRREAFFDHILAQHREKTFQALEAYLRLTPTQVFSMVSGIASQITESTGAVPTLYRPARKDQKEYPFTENLEYFDALLEVGRPDVVEVLRDWIAPSSPVPLKFLGSDFIGRYQLVELVRDLRDQVKDKDWDALPDGEFGWVLNFIWAASRCEPQMYLTLVNWIKTTPDARVREWLLFIPQQMNDGALLNVIGGFLSRSDTPSPTEMKLVIHGLRRLYPENETTISRIIGKYRIKFRFPEIAEEVQRVWTRYNLSPDKVLRAMRLSRPNDRPNDMRS